MNFGRLILGLLTGGISELGRAFGKGIVNNVSSANNSNPASDQITDFLKDMSNEIKSQTNRPSDPSFLSTNPYDAPWTDNSDGNAISNWLKGQTGSGLTNAQIQANAYNTSERIAAQNYNHNEAVDARMWEQYVANNKYQWETQSMQNAGVNPAMVYGGGSLVGTHATGAAGSISGASSVSPGSPSLDIGGMLNSFMALARMPLELKALNAQIGQTRANTKLTEQKTETEVQLTRIQSINADYQDAFNEQTLDNLKATYDNTIADTDYKTANKDYILTQKDAQDILNKYLDERQIEEINQIKANTNKLTADEKYTKSQTTYQNWYNNFVQVNGFLPSSNDALLLGTYVASLFGVEKTDVKKVLDEILDDFVPGHKKAGARKGKGGETSPTGGEGASNTSTGSGSR